jgi:hypothetical protein
MTQAGTDVVVDVTSLTSAEDFLVSQNHHATPSDPFARQCFVEIVQSLIFMSRVHVPHPTLYSATPEDYGRQPFLLRELMSAGLLHPVRLDARQERAVRRLESESMADLQSLQGIRSMARFIEHVLTCDTASAGRQQPLGARISAWNSFHQEHVRSAAEHHRHRIQTLDGVEDDAFGEWAHAASTLLAGTLNDIVGEGSGAYLMATLARAVKYRARAEALDLPYQSHPMRRDFSLTFDLTRGGAADETVLDLIKEVRGIHRSLMRSAQDEDAHRMRLLELELPLLGGRLWTSHEIGLTSDAEWIKLVVGKISQYRERTADLRMAVQQCVTEEDQVRLRRDIDKVTGQLLDRLGLRSVELSPVERELVDSVASVTQVTPGVPRVSGLWFGVRALGKRFTFPGAQPYQRFLYREFIGAWKRSGR